MNKWILSALISCSISYTAVSQTITPLEQWTYDGLTAGNPLSSAPSLISGSVFGTGAEAFLKISISNAQIKASGAADEGYSEGLTGTYSGQDSGIYQISYDIPSAGFLSFPANNSGRFGWGLRSNVSGPDDCKVYFRYISSKFELIVHDANGEQTPELIEAKKILSAPVSIRQVYFLDNKGTPGSFKVYWSIGGGAEQEILPGQLTLHADFQLDEFLMEVDAKSNGFNWNPANIANIDNLSLVEIEANPELSFLKENVSLIQDNGVLANTTNSVTYEPGDVLQIITTNQNTGFAIANDVSTSLSSTAGAFSITPASQSIGSVDVGETYTATYQVTILDGAVNGSNTFSVVNQIGTGAKALTFPASF